MITKETMNRKKCWLLLLLLLTAISPWVMAQSGEPLLPGSASKLDKAVSKTDTIVIAKLLSLGITSPDAIGEADYDLAQIAVIKTLKGAASGNLTISIKVHYLKGRIEEVAPQEGKEYLFFIHTDETKRLVALKILPADTSNVNAVTAAVTK
jgi:hypothetical protein